MAQDQCRRALRRARRQARSSAAADSSEQGGAQDAAHAGGRPKRQGADQLRAQLINAERSPH